MHYHNVGSKYKCQILSRKKNIIIRPNHFKTGRDVFEEPWFMVKLVYITGAVLNVTGFLSLKSALNILRGEKKKDEY